MYFCMENLFSCRHNPGNLAKMIDLRLEILDFGGRLIVIFMQRKRMRRPAVQFPLSSSVPLL